MRNSWYHSKGSMGQRIIIEEGTGKSIAVAYDEIDAPLLAAAPNMLKLLEKIQAGFDSGTDIKSRHSHEVRYAIREAKGGE